jgi:hypothetical protein
MTASYTGSTPASNFADPVDAANAVLSKVEAPK